MNAISSYKCGCGRGRGHGRNYEYHAYDNNPSNSQKRKASFHPQKRKRSMEKDEENIQSKSSKIQEETCYKCGIKGHWSRTCCMTKHLVDLYQAYLKDEGKNVEMNFTNINVLDLSYYDVDLIGRHNKNFNYLTNDENANIE